MFIWSHINCNATKVMGVFRGLLLNWQKIWFIIVAGIAFTVKLWSLY